MSEEGGLTDFFSFMQGNILVMTVTRVTGMFCRSMIFPYASLYILALGGGEDKIGLINSLRPLAGLVMFPISGYLTDIGGRVKLIALAGYFSGLSLLLYVFAPSWHWIALGGLIRGFMVFQFPPTSAILADSLDPEKRGTGMATMNTLSSTVAILSPYVAGLVLTMYGNNMGMRILYSVMMIVYLLNATINLSFLEDTSEKTEEDFSISDTPEIVKEAFSGFPPLFKGLPVTVKALSLIIILGFMSNAISSPFWVVYATNEIGLTSIEWGTILFIEMGIRTLLYIPAGVIVDRYGRTKSIIAALLLSLASIPLFIFSSNFLNTLLVRSAVAVMNSLFLPACSALMADTVPREKRGRVMAALGRGTVFLGATGGGTGGPGVGYIITIPIILSSVAGGYLYTFDPRYPWIFVTASIIISLVVSVLYIRDPEEAEI